MAGAAMYAVDRLKDGKSVIQADVVDVASTLTPTSKYQIKAYSKDIHDAAETRL